MHASDAASVKTVSQRRLHQHFPTGKRDPAARGAKEDIVLHHLTFKLIQRDIPPDVLKRAGRALIGIPQAGGTVQTFTLPAHRLDFR
jgi:hypothetical protein